MSGWDDSTWEPSNRGNHATSYRGRGRSRGRGMMTGSNNIRITKPPSGSWGSSANAGSNKGDDKSSISSNSGWVDSGWGTTSAWENTGARWGNTGEESSKSERRGQEASKSTGWGDPGEESSKSGGGWGGNTSKSEKGSMFTGWENAGKETSESGGGWGENTGSSEKGSTSTGWGSTSNAEWSNKTGIEHSRAQDDAGSRQNAQTLNVEKSPMKTTSALNATLPSPSSSTSSTSVPLAKVLDHPHATKKDVFNDILANYVKRNATGKVPLPKRHQGPKDRLRTYDVLISTVLDAVLLKVELSETQQELDAVKRLQTSEQFSHPSPDTKARLDQLREAVELKYQEIYKNLEKTVFAALDLPNFLSNPEQRTVAISEEELQILQFYNTESNDWLSELKRLKAAAEDMPTKVEEPRLAKKSHAKASEILEREDSLNWTGVDATIDHLSKSVAKFVEEYYAEQFTVMFDVDELVDNQKKATGKLKEMEAPQIDQEEILKSKLKNLNEMLKSSRSMSDELLDAVISRYESLKSLEMDNAKLNEICDELENQLQLIEKVQTENQIIADNLLEEVKKLHDQRPHDSSASPPVTLEDIQPHILTMVHERLDEFLLPFLENLREHCTQNNKGVESEVFRVVNIIVKKTSEIREAVRSDMSRKPGQKI